MNSSLQKKLLTVVTVCYNAENNIEATLLSVIKNITTDVDYLVVDGNSTDETISIINKYKSSIAKIICEKDEGIYDAMNKAIKNCNSHFILFINSGDILQQLPLKVLEKNKEASLISFPVSIGKTIVKYPKKGFTINITNTLPHQGCFYKVTNDFKFNTKYKIYADYALNLLLFKNNKKILLFRQPIVATHMLDGVSNKKSSANEFFQLVKNENGFFYYFISFCYFKLRGLKNRILCFL